MSERKSRFRIKNEEIEIEYEGSSQDVNERFSEVFEWLRSVPRRRVSEKRIEEKKEGKKDEKRGGARKSLYSPKIDELIKENFFKLPNKKKVSDVLKALMETGLPTAGKDTVIINALKRRLGKILKGTKEGKEWVFWTE